MSKVILKDKKDLNHLPPEWHNWAEVTQNSYSWSDYKIVGSQDEIERDLEVEILSVKFSKIGQKTFDAYPNLKWIICRSHEYDNINMELAKKYNVGISCLNPSVMDVADWIMSRESFGEKLFILGCGRIGREVVQNFNDEKYKKKHGVIPVGDYLADWQLPTEVTSNKISVDEKNLSPSAYAISFPAVSTFTLKDFDTIVVTSSPTEIPILTEELLSSFHGNVISISRPCCIDNKALLNAINDGRVLRADMDMLDSKDRNELIATGKCNYYGHVAWGDAKSYDDDYFSGIFHEIHYLVDPKKIHLAQAVVPRRTNALFGD